MKGPEKLGRVIEKAADGRLDEATATEIAAAVLREFAGMPTVEAVRRDLDRISEQHPEVARSGLAATAQTLALELDSPWNTATSKSMCATALQKALDRLAELAPAPPKKDAIDEVAARREQRRRRPGAKASRRS